MQTKSQMNTKPDTGYQITGPSGIWQKPDNEFDTRPEVFEKYRISRQIFRRIPNIQPISITLSQFCLAYRILCFFPVFFTPFQSMIKKILGSSIADLDESDLQQEKKPGSEWTLKKQPGSVPGLIKFSLNYSLVRECQNN